MHTEETEQQDLSAIRAVCQAQSFKDLCKLEGINLVKILHETFRENDFTRLIRFLCDPRTNGMIEDRFVVSWLKPLLRSPLSLRRRYDVTAECNWQTPSNRYLDLLIKIRPRGECAWSTIVGVEAKINASESDNQLRDYQDALAREFNGDAQHLVVFLTTDKRGPTTHSPNHRTCPCVSAGYLSIAQACRAVLKGNQGTLDPCERLLLEHTASYIDNHLDGPMTKTEKLIKGLLNDPTTRPGIERIQRASYVPTMRSLVYEMLLPKIRREIGNDIEVAWHHPKKEASPGEFNFRHEHLAQGIYYMLHCGETTRAVNVGDEISILVMAYDDHNNPDLSITRKTRHALDHHLKLPASEGRCRPWDDWTCLCVGKTYVLKDLGNTDSEALADAYVDAYNKTGKLLAALASRP